MDFFCPTIVKKFCCLTKLSSAHNGVIDQKETLVFDQRLYRDQFHAGNQISLFLILRHKRTRPSRCIFDKRTGKWNTGFIGIADGMGNSGIWNSCDNIWSDIVKCITFCKHSTAFVTHFFYIDAFVGRGRVSIVNPKERTDLHIFFWFTDSLDTIRCDVNDLSRS